MLFLTRIFFLTTVSPLFKLLYIFLILMEGITFAEIKRQLSTEEHEKTGSSDYILNLNDMTPSTFVTTGLEIEEQQYVIESLQLHLQD